MELMPQRRGEEEEGGGDCLISSFLFLWRIFGDCSREGGREGGRGRRKHSPLRLCRLRPGVILRLFDFGLLRLSSSALLHFVSSLFLPLRGENEERQERKGIRKILGAQSK